MAQPHQTTQNRYLRVVPNVKNTTVSMFPFGMTCKSNSYQTETFKIPKKHISYSLSRKRNIVYHIKCDSINFMRCKKSEYNILYRNFADQKTIGDKIRYVRLHAGLTKKQLADLIRVSVSCINDYELNYVSEALISIDLLYKIEDVCSVPRYTVFSEYLIYYDTQQLQKDMNELGLLQIDIARYLKVDRHTVSKWRHKKGRLSPQMWQSTIKLFQTLRTLPKSEIKSYLSSIDSDELSSNV